MSYGGLTAENAAILFVDHQTGLSNRGQDQSIPVHYRRYRANQIGQDL